MAVGMSGAMARMKKLLNLLPVAQRTNALTYGAVERT